MVSVLNKYSKEEITEALELLDNESNNDIFQNPQNYIYLKGANMVIRGDQISSSVPLEVITLRQQVSILSPQGPVKLSIESR